MCSYFLENVAKLSVILFKSFGVSYWRVIELPELFSHFTWDIGLHSAKMILIENIWVFFLFSHHIQNFMLNVSLNELSQNIKIVFNNQHISIF